MVHSWKFFCVFSCSENLLSCLSTSENPNFYCKNRSVSDLVRCLEWKQWIWLLKLPEISRKYVIASILSKHLNSVKKARHQLPLSLSQVLMFYQMLSPFDCIFVSNSVTTTWTSSEIPWNQGSHLLLVEISPVPDKWKMPSFWQLHDG